MTGAPELVLLYDGHCALCNGVVRFVLKHDRTRTMYFASQQSEIGRALAARRADLIPVISVALVDSRSGTERVHVRSAAVLAVAAYLGPPWSWVRALWIVPRPLRDFAYDVIARTRYKVFGKYDACPLPPTDAQHRFLN